eukprot:12250274-Ditylum_brightwellii.AAC.1
MMPIVWKKISHTHNKNYHGSIKSRRIPESWPHIREDINTITTLENPKKANEWRLIKTPHKVAHYLKLCNRLHFGQVQGITFTVPPLSIAVAHFEAR